MEDHPKTENCLDLAKINTGSLQDYGKKYPYQDLVLATSHTHSTQKNIKNSSY